MPPYRVGFLGRLGLKTGVQFAHFVLESVMVFKGTTGVYGLIYRFNSKCRRKERNKRIGKGFEELLNSQEYPPPPSLRSCPLPIIPLCFSREEGMIHFFVGSHVRSQNLDFFLIGQEIIRMICAVPIGQNAAIR